MKGLQSINGIVIGLLALVVVCMAGPGTVIASDLELEQSVIGNKVVFTVNVNNAPNQVKSLGLDIKYDPLILSFDSAVFSDTLIEDWYFKHVSNPQEGTLRFGGFTADDNTISSGSSGALMEITFEVVDYGQCPVTIKALKDDVSGWGTRGAAF